MNPLTDSVPPAHTTSVDARPDTVTEADAWGRAAQLLEGAAKQLHRAADIYEQLGVRVRTGEFLRMRARSTESDAAWCRGHADVLLAEQRRKIAETSTPPAGPGWQGEGSGLPPGPPPAESVGSVATARAAGPTTEVVA